MINTDQAIILGSPEDSDGSDDTEREAKSTSRSSLFGEAGQRAPGQSDEGYCTEEDSNLENYQVVRRPVPCINAIGSGCTDPFQTLPNLAGGDTEVLTHHCMYLPRILSYPCVSLLQGLL
jgi:hypothetical protein